MSRPLDIAVLLPCHNEELTIAACVADFRQALPHARIYVFDNASTDRTSEIARKAGAIVQYEPRKGKGNVVRRMFAEIDADLYLMADGDGTYDASGAPKLIDELIRTRADMAVGARAKVKQDAGRRGHAFGNWLFNEAYTFLFGKDFTDIFSGYRVFSRRFVKSFPALSSGFETETEMSVFASQARLPVVEIELPYGKRPEGSTSKLSSIRDGLRIGFTFMSLFKTVHPNKFFGTISVILGLLSIALAIPLAIEYAQTGLVPRIPTAILCTGIMLTALLTGVCGVVLSALNRAQSENKRLFYLACPPNRIDLGELADDARWDEMGADVRVSEGARNRLSA